MDHRSGEAGPVTIGVDLGGTGTRVVALGPGGTVLEHVTHRTAAGGASAAVRELLTQLAEVARGREVTAAGIGASGPVTPGGTIDNPATLPAYTGIDLCSLVEKETGWPCVIDNDAAAAALGEHRYGAGRGSSTCLVVTLGTGIGVGVVIGGQLFRGGDGTHPEAGHIAVPEAPRPCYCGLPRCWEQAASRTALEALAGGDLAGAGSAARSGDAGAACSFAQYGQRLAAGLGTLLTVFRPDRVVLAGSVARYLDLFAPALAAGLARDAPYQWIPPVLAAELGDLAGAVGAAVLARTVIPAPHPGHLGRPG